MQLAIVPSKHPIELQYTSIAFSLYYLEPWPFGQVCRCSVIILIVARFFTSITWNLNLKAKRILRWRRRSNITETGARRWEARYIPDFPLPARQPSYTLYSRWQSVSSSTYILLDVHCHFAYISSLNPPFIPLTALLSRSPGKIWISFRQTRNIHVSC